MNQVRQGRVRLLALAGAVLLAGCLPAGPPTTEEMAETVHRDLRLINDAVQRYKADHDGYPEGSYWKVGSALFQGGYIEAFPTPPPAIFTDKIRKYEIYPRYDTMDAGPEMDAALIVIGIKDEVCRDYNDRFSSNRSGPAIYDYQANGNRYPGEVIGREMITYAIKWESAAVDDCEIEWVIEYR